MAQTVVFEGQWSIARFLKPFKGFEQVYQGESGSRPIAFPGTLDLYAQKKLPGYDPFLLAGVTVPLGAQVRIWIPLTISGGEAFPRYNYQIVWRLRTVNDFITGQGTGQVSAVQTYSAYHLGVGPLGQPESIGSASAERYFLPGALETAIFPQAQPADLLAGSPGVLQLQGQVLQPVATPTWLPPLTATGKEAAWQQGVYPSSNALATSPTFLMYELEAQGDELSIFATRASADTESAWDFTKNTDDGDLSFSTTYGNDNGAAAVSPYTAILLMVGTK